MKTLILDNYDSFTYNLYQYVGELGGNPVVFYNNQITLKEINKHNPTHIIISPGPGTVENPSDFGICREVILKLGQHIPILGVCLGHQGICHAFGGKIEQAAEIMHGKTSMLEHNNQGGIFTDVRNPFEAMRYHSLIASWDNFPQELEVTAITSQDGVAARSLPIIMALQHKKYPTYGIQFHPESIGTPEGKKIVSNFLHLTK